MGLIPICWPCPAPIYPPGPHGKPDAAQPEVFYVPKGTLVVIRPGVWHGSSFVTGSEPVNVMVVLPERTYATDCTVERMDPVVTIQ